MLKMRTVDNHNWGVESQNAAMEGREHSQLRSGVSKWSHWGPWTLKIEEWSLKMEPFRAVDTHYWGVEFQNRAMESRGHLHLRSWVLNWSHWGPWTLTIEECILKGEPWRICRPMVPDSHHFEEKQNPDPDPKPHHSGKDSHQSEKRDLDLDPHLNEC
jgi:hypothetical protein